MVVAWEETIAAEGECRMQFVTAIYTIVVGSQQKAIH
jgi:hypothetical protein